MRSSQKQSAKAAASTTAIITKKSPRSLKSSKTIQDETDLLVQGATVALRYNLEEVGTIRTLGLEVSEVRFPIGDRNITNEYLVRVKPR